VRKFEAKELRHRSSQMTRINSIGRPYGVYLRMTQISIVI